MTEKSETVYFTERGFISTVYAGQLILKDGADLVVRREDGRLFITSNECLVSVDEYEKCVKEQKADVIVGRLSTRAIAYKMKMETLDKVLDELVSIREVIEGDDG